MYKMNRSKQSRDIENIPPPTWEVLKDVNIFKEDLEPQPSADPMVCDSRILLDKNEMAFLRKGPKFMVRQKTRLNDFKTDLEKMSVKQKYEESNEEPNVSHISDSGATRNLSETDKEMKRNVDIITAKANLFYDKDNNCLNLNKCRATDYKFNRMVHLPRPQSASRETLHEVRKVEMLNIFTEVTGLTDQTGGESNSTVKNRDNRSKASKKSCLDSNLSKSEVAGMLSLQERVKRKEIIITETDKSGKFAVLNYDQYLSSGLKHTKNDCEIDWNEVNGSR